MRFSFGAKEEESYWKIIETLESTRALHLYESSLELVHVVDSQPSGIASSLYMITDRNKNKTWWPVTQIL